MYEALTPKTRRYIDSPSAFRAAVIRGLFVTVYYDAGSGDAARSYFTERGLPYEGVFSGIVLEVDDHMVQFKFTNMKGVERYVAFSRTEIIDIV